IEKKLAFIEHAIQKDSKFRSAFKGMVLALFTIDEYLEYIKNASNLNKRMMSMLIERFKSQVQLFEKPN
ncbi:glyoxalase, partial [Flavobacterium sp. XS1P32]